MTDPEHIEHIPAWAVAAVTTIFTGLTGAIVFMFKLGESKGKATLERIQQEHSVSITELKTDRDQLKVAVDQCTKDREELRVQLAGVEVRLEMLEKYNGRPELKPTKE